mmetsp:Transcript_57719/g.160886  ORF Transcript_57719/g.160886 Transcript_57719/m.160886 type:complete len:81 (+) Transcript_57719:577-819(+)
MGNGALQEPRSQGAGWATEPTEAARVRRFSASARLQESNERSACSASRHQDDGVIAPLYSLPFLRRPGLVLTRQCLCACR